jgi:L-lactate dehydrogenase (cytochrome)
LGRSYLYGLGAAGESGVEQVLSMLTDDLERTMSLCGVRNISEITPELVSLVPSGLI